ERRARSKERVLSLYENEGCRGSGRSCPFTRSFSRTSGFDGRGVVSSRDGSKIATPAIVAIHVRPAESQRTPVLQTFDGRPSAVVKRRASKRPPGARVRR